MFVPGDLAVGEVGAGDGGAGGQVESSGGGGEGREVDWAEIAGW